MVTDTPSSLPSHRRLWRLFSPTVYTFMVFAFLWMLHEIAEQAYPAEGHSGEFVGTFHVIRFVVGVTCAAVALAWGVIRVSTPILDWSVVDRDAETSVLSERGRSRAYAKWFIVMRWVALITCVTLILITIPVLRQLPNEVFLPLLLLSLALAGSNLVYLWLIRKDHGAQVVLTVQGYVDLVILTLMLHFAGGVENPLTSIMVFHVLIGGILLGRRHCFGIASVGTLLFAVLVFLEAVGLVGHYTLRVFPHYVVGSEIWHAAHQSVYVVSRLMLHAVLLFLTAFFVTSLTDRLHRNEQRLGQMAERARADQELLEQCLVTTGMGLRVLDPQMRTSWINARWRDWFSSGSPPKEGDRDERCGRPDLSAEATLRDGRVRVTETEWNEDGDGANAGKAPSHAECLQVTTAPLMSSGAKIQGVVQLAQDITLQKNAHAQLLRAGRLAAVGELAGHVAHEVNNPIAIISAKASLLLSRRKEEMSSRVAGEIGKMMELSNRVADIAKGLLSYCRRSPKTRHKLDIRQPIRKSLGMIEQRARSLQVRVEDALPTYPLRAEANGQEMEQVFLNLFLNALDAMPEGGTLRVEAKIEDDPPSVKISVKDTGMGIEPDLQSRIFEPFFTTKDEGHGTGLGLAICAGLMRSHGGAIEVHSGAGQGTAFVVSLPQDESGD